MCNTNIINKRLYDFPASGLCGVFMPEIVMRKVAKLGAEYSTKLQKILNDHKDEIYVSHWTCANHEVNGKIEKQVVIHYIKEPSNTWDTIDHRISLFGPPKPNHVETVYKVESHEHAKEIAESLLAEELAGGAE